MIPWGKLTRYKDGQRIRGGCERCFRLPKGMFVTIGRAYAEGLQIGPRK